MSSQKGNICRSRSQKHQNKFEFKNDLHDTNIRTKRMNQIQISNVCNKCKNILEWKIKFKKYKLLKAPKSCNKCFERNVKQPYHTVCTTCSLKHDLCPKCEIPLQNIETIQNEILASSNNNENIDSDCSSDFNVQCLD